MIRYGDGKAGQWCKSEAQKRFSRFLGICFLAVGFGGLLAGILIGAIVANIIFFYFPHPSARPQTFYSRVFLVIAFLISAVCWVAYRKLEHPLDEIARERIRYLRGGQTEALVAYALDQLSDGWHLFNNVEMKGGGDIDHVLIGPGGLFCISTKSVKGIYDREAKSGFFTLNGERTRHVVDAQQQAMRLRHWLEAGLQSVGSVKSIPFVRAVLVVPFAHINFPAKSDNVWVMDEGELFSHTFDARTELNRAQIDACVYILQKLTQRSRYVQAVSTEPASEQSPARPNEIPTHE